MADQTLTPAYRHEPVMLEEVLSSLALKPGSTVCDCTLGGAGHSVRMAAEVGEEGLLIGIDQDDMALAAASQRLDREAPCVPHKLLKGNFGNLDELLCSAEVPGVDGFLFDLGVSSPQLDIPGRGFSYHEDAPRGPHLNRSRGHQHLHRSRPHSGPARLRGGEVRVPHCPRDRAPAREGADRHDGRARRVREGGHTRRRAPTRRPPGQAQLPGHSHRGQPRARRAGKRP